MVRGQYALEHGQPVVKGMLWGRSNDRLAEDCLKSRDIIVGFRQLLIGVVKDVLHLWNAIAQIDRERCAVFSSRQAQDVPRLLAFPGTGMRINPRWRAHACRSLTLGAAVDGAISGSMLLTASSSQSSLVRNRKRSSFPSGR